MNDRTFEKQENAKNFLQIAIAKNLNVSSDLAKEAAEKLVSVYREECRGLRTPGVSGMLIKPFKWVIRDDDLKLMQAVFEGLKAATQAGFFTAAGVPIPAKWTGAVAIAAVIFTVAKQALTKGKRLDKRDFEVLYTLNSNKDGFKSEELHKKLHSKNDSWTEEEVEERLKNLKKIPVKNGTLKSFTVQEANDRWRTVGI